ARMTGNRQVSIGAGVRSSRHALQSLNQPFHASLGFTGKRSHYRDIRSPPPAPKVAYLPENRHQAAVAGRWSSAHKSYARQFTRREIRPCAPPALKPFSRELQHYI